MSFGGITAMPSVDNAWKKATDMSYRAISLARLTRLARGCCWNHHPMDFQRWRASIHVIPLMRVYFLRHASWPNSVRVVRKWLPAIDPPGLYHLESKFFHLIPSDITLHLVLLHFIKFPSPLHAWLSQLEVLRLFFRQRLGTRLPYR